MTLTLTSKTWARWARMERAPHRIPSDRALDWLVANYGGTHNRRSWTVECAVSKSTLAMRLTLKWPLREALTRPADCKIQKPKPKKLPPARRPAEPEPVMRKRPRITAEDTATAEREAALTRTVRQLQADVDRLQRENARLRVEVARQKSTHDTILY